MNRTLSNHTASIFRTYGGLYSGAEAALGFAPMRTPFDFERGMQRQPFQSPQGFQQRIKRIIQQQQIVSSNQLTFQLPRNYDIETVYVNIQGSITYPAALTNNAIRSDAPFGYMTRVEVIAEGRQTLFSVPGYILGMMNVRRHKRPTYRERVETYGQHQSYPLQYVAPTSAMTVSTTQTWAGTICIDFQNIAGIRPKDTNLRSGGLQTLDLKITFGDITTFFYGLAGAPTATPFAAPNPAAQPSLATYTLTPGLCTVAISEIQELADKSGKISSPTWVQRWTHQDANVAGAQANFQLLLPTDNFVGAVMLCTKIAGESVDGVLSNIYLRRGIDVRYNLPVGTIQQAISNLDYDWYLSPGFYVADLVGVGQSQIKIAESWNLQGGADTRVAVDTLSGNAFTNLGVTTVEYIPLKQG